MIRNLFATTALTLAATAAYADPAVISCDTEEAQEILFSDAGQCELKAMRDGAEWTYSFNFLRSDEGVLNVEIILYDQHGERREDLHAEIEDTFMTPRVIDLNGDGTPEIEVVSYTGNANSYGTLFIATPEGYQGWNMPMTATPVDGGFFQYWERESAMAGTDSFHAIVDGKPVSAFSLYVTHPPALEATGQAVTPEAICQVTMGAAGLSEAEIRAKYCPKPEDY